MSNHSRRDFLKTGSAAVLYGAAFARGTRLEAQSLGLPLGVQLYSVREMLPTNYEGTLKQVGALGYKEVEAAGFFNHTAAQVKQAMQDAGLRCVSAHHDYEELDQSLEQVIAFHHEIGSRYVICSSPGFKNPSLEKNLWRKKNPYVMTLDDWRWNADQFNRLGEKVNAAGLKFGYHNHTMEFQKQNGVVPYIELLRLTDPSKVTMEMDCGWVVVGGGNPVELLQRYPTRFSMLHVKDFKRVSRPVSVTNPPPIVELGQGSIDYRPIFREAAKTGRIKHCFVEQEESEIPRMESLKIDAEYMRKLDA